MSLRSFMGRLLGFREPPPAPREPIDKRNWNEDWKVGDTAECICGPEDWHVDCPPWYRPAKGQRFTVLGFFEAVGFDGSLRYFLTLEGWPVPLTTSAFRKVRPVTAEQSEVVSRILNAKPGTDRVREDV